MRPNPNARLAGSVLSHPKPGRKPKHDVAMTPAQRKANERKRKRWAAQQAFDQRRLKQWDQGRFDKENSVNKGRLHGESSQAPEKIDAIRHGQYRDALTGGVSPEQLAQISTWQGEAPTGGGKRVRPAGHGDYKNSDYSGNESQIANPIAFSEVVTAKSGRKFNLREFVETHFRQILYCAYPNEVAIGPEGRDVPAWSCYLQCSLCSYETTNFKRFKTHSRLYSNEPIARAKTHVRDYHLAEFQNWQVDDHEELPAWLDPIREKQLRGEPLKHECPVKAKHEEWRLKAKQRYEEAVSLMPLSLAIECMKESVICPICKVPIFLPPEVAPKPDMKLLSSPKRDVPSATVGIVDARLALRIAMNQYVADTSSPDPDEGNS